MNEDCPIVPNEIFGLRYGEGEDEMLLVAASHDTVQRFTQEEFDHLRYYDNDDGAIRAVFLADHILDWLVEQGIPEVERESITKGEHEAYQHFIGNVAVSDCIEVEEVEYHLEDAEINYFITEWSGE